MQKGKESFDRCKERNENEDDISKILLLPLTCSVLTVDPTIFRENGIVTLLSAPLINHCAFVLGQSGR